MNERDEFEAFWRREMNVEVMDLTRTDYPMTAPEDQQYLCHETNRSWITWQAARAQRGVSDLIKAIADKLEKVEGESADGGYMWDARECAEFIREEADALICHAFQPDKWIPEGWKVVPVESTEDMDEYGARVAGVSLTAAEFMWNAMLAVAPSPPEQEPNQ